jgi:hypothetical protein
MATMFFTNVELLPIPFTDSPQAQAKLSLPRPDGKTTSPAPVARLIEEAVEAILSEKKAGRDTGDWEAYVDRLVYGLYGLTEGGDTKGGRGPVTGKGIMGHLRNSSKESCRLDN